MRWVHHAQFARLYEISRNAVSKAVKAGRLVAKNGLVDAEVDIRATRTREPSNERKRDPEPQATGSLTEQLQRAKLAKIQADTVIQEQKDARTREEWRRRDMEEFGQAFAETFAPVKKRLIEMRLPADKLAALKAIWDECWAAFARRVDEGIEADEGQ